MQIPEADIACPLFTLPLLLFPENIYPIILTCLGWGLCNDKLTLSLFLTNYPPLFIFTVSESFPGNMTITLMKHKQLPVSN